MMWNVTAESETSLDEKKDILSDEQFLLARLVLNSAWMMLSLCGVLSNGATIWTYNRLGIKDGVTVSFLALSISDFAYTFCVFLSSIITVCTFVEKMNGVHFKIQPFAIATFVNISHVIFLNITVLNTTYIALARCMCVVKPLTFRDTFSYRRSKIILMFFAIFTILLHTPILANMGLQTITDPSTNISTTVLWLSSSREFIKDLVWLISDLFFAIVTQLIVSVSALFLIKSMKASFAFRQTMKTGMPTLKAEVFNISGKSIESNGQKATSNNEKMKNKDAQVVQQVVLISVLYIVCNIPKMVFSIAGYAVPEFDIGKQYSNLYLTVIMCRTCCDLINSSFNFFIYLKFNSKFRQQWMSPANCEDVGTVAEETTQI